MQGLDSYAGAEINNLESETQMAHDDQNTRRWRRIVRNWQRDLRVWLARPDAGSERVGHLEDRLLNDGGVREQRLLLAAGSTVVTLDVFA